MSSDVQVVEKELEGRPHLVVPVVLQVEGVAAGSQGPIHYPKDELEASAPYWNGRPICIYHPDMLSGGAAGVPEVFTRQRCGTLFNVSMDGPRLIGQAWLDVERVKILDEQVFQAVKKGEAMEVSTGLYLDTENASGTDSKGRPYERVATNLRPDHLALLPTGVGACSVADGAGLCRNQSWLGPLVAPSLA